MKKALIPGLLLAGIAIAGCGGHTTVQSREFRSQSQDASTFEASQPLPHFNYSQLRQNLIEIETAQAQGVQSTTFFFNWGGTNPIKVCPSIGAPIPTTDQISNPEQPLRDNSQPLNNGGGNVTVGQIDPNGVYSGQSTGTYVICVGSDGKPRAAYWEGYVETEFAPATWNSSSHAIQDVGPSTFKLSTSKTNAR